MRLEDFLHDRSVSLEVRIGTLLSASTSFGDINFVVHAEMLIEEYNENPSRGSGDLYARLLRAKNNRQIKISKISQN